MKGFLLSLGLLLACVTASLAQDKNEVVPLGDPAYADIALLTKGGIIEDCNFGGPRNPTMTRYEFAVGTARLLRNLSPSGPLPSSPGTLSPTRLEVLAAAKRLALEFRTEMRSLGIDVDQIKIKGVFLIEPEPTQPKLPVAPPFADVPKDHWAYEAVETLRQAGIIIGIPAGDKTLFNSPTTK